MQFLIADDHDLVTAGLQAILGRLGPDNRILTHSHFADALEAARGKDLDLVVLGQGLSGMDGVKGVEVFRSYFPEPRVVVLARRYQSHEALAALRYGAAGLIPLGLKAEAMVNAFRLILSGERYVPAEIVLEQALAEAHGNGKEDRSDHPLRRLTEREEEVLGRLLEGLANKEIGRALEIQEVTVKLHLRSIYRKLAVKNRAQAIRLAFEAGWRA